MPKIAELKEIDGNLWARLDIGFASSPISIYTEHEIKAIRKDERRLIIEMINEMPK